MAAEVFYEFDKDKSGCLTPHELWEALVSVGCNVTHSRVESLIKIIDANSDGKVQLCEFEQLLYILQHADLACYESILFYAIDTDRSGSIGPAELHKIFERMGLQCSYERVARLIQQISGRELTYDEFKGLMAIVHQCLARCKIKQMLSSANPAQS